MKKTARQVLFFLGFFFLTSFSFGQGNIAPAVIRNFPMGIVRKIYQTVVSKVDLSEYVQLLLATAYMKQDSLIAGAIFRGEKSALQIARITDSTDWLIEDEFKANLSSKEKLDYENNIESKRVSPYPVFKGKVYMDEEMNSQFGLAFKVRTLLQLSDSQCVNILKGANELKTKIDFYNNNPDSGFFDRAAFENDYLSKILSERQYNDMLANKNAPQSKLLAKYVWHDLKVAGLESKFNKDSTLNKVTIYYMLKTHISERFANEKERRAIMLGALKLPDAIRALQAVKLASKQKLDKYSW
jgi:hypothetical protein